MGRDSSTSSSSWRQLRRGAGCLLVVFVGWLLLGWLVEPLADSISGKFGDYLSVKSRGKVVDPRGFVANRLQEVVNLVAFSSAGIVLYWWAYLLMARCCNRQWLFLPMSLLAFLVVNVFVGYAAETGIFWTALFATNENSRQPAFHIGRVLHRESRARVRGILLGSSQAASEIEETTLNREFGPDVHFASMTYSGSGPLDFLLTKEWFKTDPPDVVVCYLSEMNFYKEMKGERLLPLLTASGARSFFDMSPSETIPKNRILNAAAGTVMPLFRSRRSFEYAVFGTAAVEPEKSLFLVRARDSERQRTMHEKAVHRSSQYAIGRATSFQKKALHLFLQHCQRANIRVVLLAGQVSPLLSNEIGPSFREDFLRFMKSLPRRYSNVSLALDVLENHPASDYYDLVHVKLPAQARFTRKLATYLQHELGWTRIATPPPTTIR